MHQQQYDQHLHQHQQQPHTAMVDNSSACAEPANKRIRTVESDTYDNNDINHDNNQLFSNDQFNQHQQHHNASANNQHQQQEFSDAQSHSSFHGNERSSIASTGNNADLIRATFSGTGAVTGAVAVAVAVAGAGAGAGEGAGAGAGAGAETEADTEQQQQPQQQQQQQQQPQEGQTWTDNFNKLLEYGLKYGHCNVRPYSNNNNIGTNNQNISVSSNNNSNNNSDSDSSDAAEEMREMLYPWLAQQRSEHRSGKLSHERETKLQVLVDRGMLTWFGDTVYNVLTRPNVVGTSHTGIALSQSAIAIFEDFFLSLAAYAETHGHCNVRPGVRLTTIKRSVPADIGAWLASRRTEKANNTLSSEYVGYLNILVNEGLLSWDQQASTQAQDIPSNVVDYQWTRRFLRIREYVLRTNACLAETEISALHLSLSPATDPEIEQACSHMRTFDVGLWLSIQRFKYINDTLRNDHYLRLQELVLYGSFNWFAHCDRHLDQEAVRRKIDGLQRDDETLWTAWYNVVVWYGKRHGHCNMELSTTVTLPDRSEAELGKWMHQQKSAIKHFRMKIERVQAFQTLVDRGLVNSNWKDLLTAYHQRVSDVNNRVCFKQLLTDMGIENQQQQQQRQQEAREGEGTLEGGRCDRLAGATAAGSEVVVGSGGGGGGGGGGSHEQPPSTMEASLSCIHRSEHGPGVVGTSAADNAADAMINSHPNPSSRHPVNESGIAAAGISRGSNGENNGNVGCNDDVRSEVQQQQQPSEAQQTSAVNNHQEGAQEQYLHHQHHHQHHQQQPPPPPQQEGNDQGYDHHDHHQHHHHHH